MQKTLFIASFASEYPWRFFVVNEQLNNPSCSSGNVLFQLLYFCDITLIECILLMSQAFFISVFAQENNTSLNVICFAPLGYYHCSSSVECHDVKQTVLILVKTILRSALNHPTTSGEEVLQQQKTFWNSNSSIVFMTRKYDLLQKLVNFPAKTSSRSLQTHLHFHLHSLHLFYAM